MITLFRSYSTLHSAFTRRQTAADIAQQLNDAQKELSTGWRNDVFADLGVRAAETLDLRATVNREEAQIAANTLLAGRMDTMADALGAIRDTIAGALELAIPNKSAKLGTVSGLQTAAAAALDSLIAKANSGHAGVPLFSGSALPGATLQPWREANGATGLSPRDVFDAVLAGGLGDATAANTAIAEVEAIFSDSSGSTGFGFEETFYNGAATGVARQKAAIGDSTVIDYGVQANDAAFRQVLKGLAMLAATDPAEIGNGAAYEAWVGHAVDALSAGSDALLATEAQVGAQSAEIEAANLRMTDRMDLYKSRIIDLEGVDSYEAATRITLLETQLQASYAVTARLSQLSFLNYMY